MYNIIYYYTYICNYHYHQSYIITEPPTVSTHHTNYNDTRSVKLIGNVSVIDQYPIVHTVYWTKNGEKIDKQAEGWKYSKVSVKSPSLTIHKVNYEDAGSYQLTATNVVGSNKSDIVLGKSLLWNSFQYSSVDKACKVLFYNAW